MRTSLIGGRPRRLRPLAPLIGGPPLVGRPRRLRPLAARAGALGRLLAVVAVLGLLAGAAGGVLVALAPVPARATPLRALLHNGYAQGIDSGSGPVWLLALGSDARPGEDILHERSDSIHLIGVNPATGAATLLGFPRDSYVNIPGVGFDKINAALSSGGPELVARTVETITGIHAQYVFITSFDGLTNMVDRMGGVTVNVDISMHDDLSGADFEPGPNTMTGGQALAFSRDRHLQSGDFLRSKHQGDLLMAVLTQTLGETKQKRGRLEQVLNFLLDDTVTDVPPSEVYRLARVAMTVDPGKISNCVAPGGVGAAGTASIVVIDQASLGVFADDIRPDATADEGCPGLPNF